MSVLHLHLIQTFREVAKQQSISAAAKRLGLSQPAVSFQMRQLEARLGVQLITRLGRRSVPTKAGDEFLKHAHTIAGVIHAALEDMSQYSEGASNTGRLRIGADPSAGFVLSPRFWRDLCRKLPNLEIKVHSWDTADIVKALDEDLLDLGLVILPPLAAAVEVRSLIHEELVLVAPGGRLPPKLTPDALAQLPLLVHAPGGEMRKIVQGWFSRAGQSFNPLMEIGDFEAITQLVADGLGYAIVPSMAVSKAAAESVSVGRLSPRLHRKLALVIKDERPLTQPLREAISLFDALASGAAGGGAPDA